MISLDTNDLGFDKHKLAFPSLKTCMAVVYQVNGGLFGWHDGYGKDEIFTMRCTQFQVFVQNNALNHWQFGENLFGLTNNKERYFDTKEGLQKWKNDLLHVASHLGFEGPVWGIRITKNIARTIGTNDSLYADFEYNTIHNKKRPILIRYKTWKEMRFSTVPQIPTTLKIYGHFDTMGRGEESKVVVHKPVNDTLIAELNDTNGSFFRIDEKEFIKFR